MPIIFDSQLMSVHKTLRAKIYTSIIAIPRQRTHIIIIIIIIMTNKHRESSFCCILVQVPHCLDDVVFK